jgi:restriction system protein
MQERNALMTMPLDYHEDFDTGSSGDNSTDESIRKSKDDSIRMFNELRSLSTDESVGICERILLKSGYKRVKITAISKGNYIEGDCIFQKNQFLWLKVLFRLNRNETSIDSKAIRGFRTAMRGHADRGILLTTNTFTMDAKWEAARKDVLPIKLIDRFKLIEIIDKL